jgi:Domain of unknown function (DUF4279)
VEAQATLSIGSADVAPEEIERIMGAKAHRVYRKNTTPDPASADFHPIHSALYAAAEPSTGIAAQIEKIVQFAEDAKEAIRRLREMNAGVGVHCICEITHEDSLDFSPDLLSRMGALGIEFVFNLHCVEHEVADTAVFITPAK